MLPWRMQRCSVRRYCSRQRIRPLTATTGWGSRERERERERERDREKPHIHPVDRLLTLAAAQDVAEFQPVAVVQAPRRWRPLGHATTAILIRQGAIEK